MSDYTPAAGSITMFSTTWCGYCRVLKNHLKRENIPFTEVNVEEDPAAEAIVIEANGGNRTVPTVVFPDGTTATNPSINEVKNRL